MPIQDPYLFTMEDASSIEAPSTSIEETLVSWLKNSGWATLGADSARLIISGSMSRTACLPPSITLPAPTRSKMLIPSTGGDISRSAIGFSRSTFLLVKMVIDWSTTSTRERISIFVLS